MKYHVFALILTCFLVSACNPINLSSGQISVMSEGQLCNLDNQFLTENTQVFLDNEMARRSADCNPNHFQCLSFGLRKGTKDYADCRLKLAHEENQYRINQESLQALQQMQNTQIQHEDNRIHSVPILSPHYNNVDVYHHY